MTNGTNTSNGYDLLTDKAMDAILEMERGSRGDLPDDERYVVGFKENTSRLVMALLDQAGMGRREQSKIDSLISTALDME